MTVTQAPELLGIAVSTVYKRVEEGHLPHVRDGTRILFRRADLDEYVAANVVPARRAPGRTGPKSLR